MDLNDEEPKFDPNLKKKKKKKTGFNIETALSEGTIPEEAFIENGSEEEPKDVKDEVIEFEDGDFGKKKSSKKKKKPFSLDDFKDLSLADGEEKEANDGLDDLEFAMDFSTKLKKKIKKKKIGLDELLADLDKDNSDAVRDNEGGDSWLSSDRDYFYEELLDRAFSDLRERNPDLATGEKKKFMMKPPQVVRIGSKKTAFVNFSDICRLMHRMPKHLLQFLLSELGTSGSIDGSNQLIIKGKFQQKQIENVLRRYIKEYVTCHTCRSPDTMLQKDARLYFLQCEQCNSRCSVTPIKSGFQAVANKQQRQAIKAGKT